MEDTIENNTQERPQTKETPGLPEIRIDKMVLYHGSGISGIKELRKAENTTIGEGLYLTSDAKSAKGYAIRRAKRENGLNPTVYEVEVNNLKLADIRTKEALEFFSSLLMARLLAETKSPNFSSLPWNQQGLILETLSKIRDKSFRALKDLIWGNEHGTTEILSSEGFDGLIAIEGGEGSEIQNHDSYLIFDPSKSRILKETNSPSKE